MNLRQLKYFVSIVDLGSLSRASESLHIAQSALSQQLAALEASMDAELLHRRSRGIVPTDAGLRLYQQAQSILRQVEDAKTDAKNSIKELSGTVAVGLPLSFMNPYAYPILRAIQDQHPKIALQFHEALSGTTLEWIKNGRLDVGIAFDEGNLIGLNTVPLIKEQLFLIVSPESPLASQKSVSLQTLEGVRLVLPGSGQGVRSQVQRALDLQGITNGIVGVEVNSLTLMKQAVIAGMGATILSWSSVDNELNDKTLVAIELTDPALSRIASICISSVTPQSVACQSVVKIIMESVREVALKAAWPGVQIIESVM